MDRLPGETDEQLKARAMATHPGAFGQVAAPALPGVLNGGGAFAQGPTRADMSNPYTQGPPKPVQSQASTGQLSGADNAAMGAMLGNYGTTLELQGLDDQMSQAQALRDTALPEGRGYGGVYTAANPLEFLGAGIKQYRGGKKAKALEEGTLKGATGGALTEDERSTLASMGGFSDEELGRKGLRKKIGKNVSSYGEILRKMLGED